MVLWASGAQAVRAPAVGGAIARPDEHMNHAEMSEPESRDISGCFHGQLCMVQMLSQTLNANDEHHPGMNAEIGRSSWRRRRLRRRARPSL